MTDVTYRTDFNGLGRAISPFTGDPDIGVVHRGEHLSADAGEWVRLGSTDYELRLNMGWRPAQWIVATFNDGYVRVGVAFIGSGFEVVGTALPGEITSVPALIAYSFQHLGGDTTLEARLRYNPA